MLKQHWQQLRSMQNGRYQVYKGDGCTIWRRCSDGFILPQEFTLSLLRWCIAMGSGTKRHLTVFGAMYTHLLLLQGQVKYSRVSYYVIGRVEAAHSA